MTTGERIKYLRKELLHMTGEKFSEPLGIQRTAISRIENGTNGLTDQLLISICRTYNVSAEWLRDGSGEPFAPQTKNQVIAEWVNRVMADKDEAFRKRFVYALSQTSEEGWEEMEKFARNLFEE